MAQLSSLIVIILTWWTVAIPVTIMGKVLWVVLSAIKHLQFINIRKPPTLPVPSAMVLLKVRGKKL